MCRYTKHYILEKSHYLKKRQSKYASSSRTGCETSLHKSTVHISVKSPWINGKLDVLPQY